MYDSFKKTKNKYEAVQLFSTFIIARNANYHIRISTFIIARNANYHIRMISDGSCDTEDRSKDDENSALSTRNKLHFFLNQIEELF